MRAVVGWAGVGLLSACSAPGRPEAAASAQRPVRVTGAAGPLGYDEGALAKRLANQRCGARGVVSSVDDRYDAGYWVFPGGCA